jgi:hypothetical protein
MVVESGEGWAAYRPASLGFLVPGVLTTPIGALSSPRCYGCAYAGAECVVHLEVTWFSVCCAFDFRYATELVIVTHELFVPTSTRYDQKSLTIKVLVRRSAFNRLAATQAPQA